MKVAISIAVMSFAAILGLSHVVGDEAAPQSAPNAGQRLPGLICQVLMQWRFGAPSFAYEQFPRFVQRDPVIFSGKMAPRGLLVIRPRVNPGVADSVQCVLRSKTVDITRYMKIEGAYYSKIGEAEEIYIAPDKLPPMKVQYEPLLPEEIVIPGAKGCTLLFEIGEGKEGEWAEGHWRVPISFDFSKLNADLLGTLGDGVQMLRTERGESKVVFSVDFVAKAVKTEADEQNLLYYQYRDCWSSGDRKTRDKSVEPLSKLIDAYPTEANLIWSRAQLWAEQGKYEDAIKDIDRIIVLLKNGTLRTALDIYGDKVTPNEGIPFLENVAKMYAREAEKQSATPPKSGETAPPATESATPSAPGNSTSSSEGKAHVLTGFPWYVPGVIILVLVGAAAFIIIRVARAKRLTKKV